MQERKWREPRKEKKVGHNKRKEASDDFFDAIAAVVLIAVAVFGVVFWLYGLPA